MQNNNLRGRLKLFFGSGSLLSLLIIINVAVWVMTLLFPLVDYLYAQNSGTLRERCWQWLALSSEVDKLGLHPWTLLTYMFLHDGFWHILFNMLMLYYGGVMCCRYLGDKRFKWIYLLSGLAGALFYLLINNIFPVGQVHVSRVVGASAAVLGVFVAVAAYLPNQEVQLWLLRTFTVKLKHVALALVVIDLLGMTGSNAGGHIAHIGGMLAGWLYVVAMRRSSGTGQKRPKRTPRLKRKKKAPQQHTQRPLTDEEYNRKRSLDQKRVDAILDKISKSGYEKLTKEEKEFLFKYKS